MVIYIESQYDPDKGTVTLIATGERSQDRYTVTKNVRGPEDARSEAYAFAEMYRRIGAEVRS